MPDVATLGAARLTAGLERFGRLDYATHMAVHGPLDPLHPQALAGLAEARPVLYVSGEESAQQTALRASRLGVRSPHLHVLAETQLERVLEEATQMRPAVLAVDSVQTMHSSALESIPGSLGQVREAAGRLLTYAKTRGVPVVLVGHVTKEGSRPILVEIQALVAHAAGMPRRTALGIDPNRVSLLLAVIERRAGIDVLGQDVFVNVAGGVLLSEPASDLGVLAAVASSARNRAIDPHTLCFGEVGLAGEIRAVGGAELRLAEAKKLGFRRCVLPELSRAQLHGKPEMELVGVRDVGAALEALLG